MFKTDRFRLDAGYISGFLSMYFEIFIRQSNLAHSKTDVFLIKENPYFQYG